MAFDLHTYTREDHTIVCSIHCVLHLTTTQEMLFSSFVRFCTWREAIKAIETYDGLYVGIEKNLQVRVAYRRRGSDDYMAMPGEGSSSDGAMQDKDVNAHPPFDTSYDL